MLFSKSAVTLFSTIGASSIPVISVVALYQIKHFSLGNNLDSSSASNSSEESVIALPEVKQPKAPEPAPALPSVSPQTEQTPEAPQVPPKPPAKKEEQQNMPEIKEEKSKDTKGQKKSAPTPNTPPGQVITKETVTNDSDATEVVVDPKINSVQDLNDLAKTILDNFINGQKQTQNDSDIAKNLDVLIDFLTKKHPTIIDKTEKTSAQEVIDSLTALKAKISTKQ